MSTEPNSLGKRPVSRRAVVGGIAGLLALPNGALNAAQASPLDPASRPVIWTTDEMLQRARSRVEERREPFYVAWLKTVEVAERVMDAAFTAYQGPNQNTYFSRGQEHGRYARDLALSYRITGDERFLDKTKQVLHNWARDAIDHPYPDPPLGFRVWPGSNLPHGSGLRIGRIMSKFADAYAMVWTEMTQSERAEIEQWMRLMIPPTLESQRIWREDEYTNSDGVHFTPPYLDQQYFNNHLTAQTLAIAAVGFATQDQSIIDLAINSPENERDFHTLIDGVILMPADVGSGDTGDLCKDDPTVTAGMPEPLPGEIYDRYRVTGSRGMLYTLTNLRFLTLIAEMTANNGGSFDYYRHIGPNGENLEISFAVYSPWWTTGQASSVNSPYYDAEQEDPGFNRIANDRVNHELSTWELALHRYPNNKKIKAALHAQDRVIFDGETWGWTAILTHGIKTGD